MLCVPTKNIQGLIDQLQDVDFTVQNRGFIDLANPNLKDSLQHWANVTEIAEQYGQKKLPSLSSEIIWFKASEKVSRVFEEAKAVHDNLKVSPNAEFNGGVPDELPLSIAMMQLDLMPHKAHWTPSYWVLAEQVKDLKEVYSNYHLISLGGAGHQGMFAKKLKSVLSYISNRTGHSLSWVAPKRNWNPNRFKL
jgi:hypothetical protein